MLIVLIWLLLLDVIVDSNCHAIIYGSCLLLVHLLASILLLEFIYALLAVLVDRFTAESTYLLDRLLRLVHCRGLLTHLELLLLVVGQD